MSGSRRAVRDAPRDLENAPGKTERPVVTATGGCACEFMRSKCVQRPSFQNVRLFDEENARRRRLRARAPDDEGRKRDWDGDQKSAHGC